jgi:REP element-mobilizing transposase RayT
MKEYNYSKCGAYFITICTKNRKCFFGEIDDDIVIRSEIGRTAEKYWCSIPLHFKNAHLDSYIIMPNHIHGLIFLEGVGAQYIEPLQKNKYQKIIPGSIGSIIRSYKGAVTRWCNKNNHKDFMW